GSGFLRAQEFGEVVKNENETGVGATRSERADGDGGVYQAGSGHNFEFAGDHAGAESAPEQIADSAGVFGADKVFNIAGDFGGVAENFHYGRISAKNVAIGIERQNTGGNIFQDSCDELASSFEFLDGLLEIAGELIDLRA